MSYILSYLVLLYYKLEEENTIYIRNVMDSVLLFKYLNCHLMSV